MTPPMDEAMELKPCPSPWCEAAEREGDYAPAVRLHHFGNYRVVCTSCILEGPLRPTEAEAIAAWNTRAAIEASGAHELAGVTASPAWQPIETAPKDGTEVLVFRKAGLQAVAAWFSEADTFAGHLGWCVTDGMGLLNVTHWMPLPAPPVQP